MNRPDRGGAAGGRATAMLALLAVTAGGCGDCGARLDRDSAATDAGTDAAGPPDGGGGDAGTDSGPGALCPSEAPPLGSPPPALSADVQPLLTANCVAMMCHATGGAGAGMWLEAGSTWSSTVGVPAAQLTETSMMNRIEPGMPDLSYVIHKLQGTHLEPTVGGVGTLMPSNGMCLPPAELGLIRAWIEAGALDD